MPAGPACAHGRRHRIELADLVRGYGDRLRAARRLTGEQLAALRAIERCRTPALGGVRETCLECGQARTIWRSCRNRHCPKCQTTAKERWLEARTQELLPVDYFHVVFTLPHALNPLARQQPRLVYRLLFQAASETLRDFAHDPKHLGATPGILAVLHTWGQNLSLHIHLHCIVTGGGLDPAQRRWLRNRRQFLFPVHALSRVFRGKYLDRLGRALDAEAKRSLPIEALRQYDWVVYAKKPFGGPRKVLDYLARYTRRVALTNNRLLDLREGIVRLRWRDYAHGGKKKILRLTAADLLGRFVLHVLPRGFQRVRHYGLFGNRYKAANLAACRDYFGLCASDPNPWHGAATLRQPDWLQVNRCAHCGGVRLTREMVLPVLLPRARAPTGEAA